MVRYEDLRAETIGTMRRIYSTLGITVDERELARAVEKHSWENIPERRRAGEILPQGDPGRLAGGPHPKADKAGRKDNRPPARRVLLWQNAVTLANQVSVVIPTFDAGPGFGELLRRIDAQEGDFERRSSSSIPGSTDGTAQLAAKHGAILHNVSKSSFDHGATRDLGISLSSGEYVALTVQDALPLDERWLAAMVENLQSDNRIAAVYGRHVPRPDAGVMTRALVGNLAVPNTERREQKSPTPRSTCRCHRPEAPHRRLRQREFLLAPLGLEEVPFGEA